MIRLLFETLSSNPVELVSKGGLLVGLLVVLVGGAKPNPWWVFGWRYREVVEERNEYKEIAFKVTNVAEAVTGTGKAKGG